VSEAPEGRKPGREPPERERSEREPEGATSEGKWPLLLFLPPPRSPQPEKAGNSRARTQLPAGVSGFSILLALILLNGVLAGAELALVTVRESQLQFLARSGDRSARAALQLRAHPERFLATVQVGITGISALAGAVGGSAVATQIAPWFARIGLEDFAVELSFLTAVSGVTYLSVVLGELVPKSIALRAPEPFALRTARPLLALAALSRPLVRLLTASSNLVLRPFHDTTDFLESRLSRDDLQRLVVSSGDSDLDAPTRRLVHRALGFTRLRVGDAMVHRREIVAVPRGASTEDLRTALLASAHRRLPVIGGTIDEVDGYVLRDDVVRALLENRNPDLTALTRPPTFVPQQTSAERALRDLQEENLHLAFVVDEAGGVAGLVTVEDLVEELVGEIFHELDEPPSAAIVERSDGSLDVEATLEIRVLRQRTGVELEAPAQVRTLGGLCIHLAGGRIPRPGEMLEAGAGLRIEVRDASPRRVRRVRIFGGGDPIS
jgi:putative hemolysin